MEITRREQQDKSDKEGGESTKMISGRKWGKLKVSNPRRG